MTKRRMILEIKGTAVTLEDPTTRAEKNFSVSVAVEHEHHIRFSIESWTAF